MPDRTVKKTEDALAAIPDLPRDTNGPVFAEPWQAQIFSMTCLMQERDLFTWSEWAETLGSVIKHQPPETEYYQCWLIALETITLEKELLNSLDLKERKDAWDRAARATPHGLPIELGAENRE